MARHVGSRELIVRPSRTALLFGVPGFLLTLLFANFWAQAVFRWDPTYILGLGLATLAFSLLWVPFVLHLVGSRAILTDTEVVISYLFGVRHRRVQRAMISGCRAALARCLSTLGTQAVFA